MLCYDLLLKIMIARKSIDNITLNVINVKPIITMLLLLMFKQVNYYK